VFVLFKFLHISAMFAVTSLAVGPIVLYYLLARTGDASALRTAYALVILPVANNLYLSGRLRRFKVSTSSNGDTRVEKLSREPALALSIALLGLITFPLVYVMIAKPTLF
jgi:hypothetical protein